MHICNGWGECVFEGARIGRHPLPASLHRVHQPSVAFALYEFMDDALCAEPRRVGKPLAEPFDGYLSARRSAYRMIYRIEDADHTARVLTVDRRADVY